MSEAKEARTPTRKPAKRKPVRKLFKSFVDIKKWSSYDEVSGHTKTTVGLFCRLLKRDPKTVRKETYDEAVTRLALTPEQVAARKKNFLHSAMIYLFFDIALFLYFIYLLLNFRLVAAFITLILVILMSLAVYREHFWYMQMCKKKLGCTFSEWKKFVLRRESN